MATVRIDGFDLYYEVHGEGFPVVFAHGVGGNHASWYPQIPVFSREFRMITFDHRGFGYLGYPGRVGMPPELTIIELKKG